MYKRYNANPKGLITDDCTIRAISKVLDKSWREIYKELCERGLNYCLMPSNNRVWSSYLRDKGFYRTRADNTVEGYAKKHRGRYILALNNHVVALIDGNYYDVWDCGKERIIYVWHEPV